MHKVFLSFLFIVVSLVARENPFFPSDNQVDITMTSNLQAAEEPLKRATLTLPSTARTLESVTVKYKNLDGSIEDKSIELHNSIDWHLPLFISQSYGDSLTNVTIESSSPSKKNANIFNKISELKFATFYESGKTLKIENKDEIIRDFLLVKPHRIVVDFKRDIDIRSFEKEIVKSPFTKIKIGNHDGYYRVVIELDGYYRYKLDKTKNGYSFTLL